MAENTEKSGFRWSSQTSLVIIAAGATLSLKDFLTFPVMAAENGGGAFIAMYAVFLFLLGLPLLMGEFMLGRMSRGNIVDALDQQAKEQGASVFWKLVGWMSLLAALLLLSSYSVISGWSLSYVFKTAFGVYEGATLDGANALFRAFQGDTEAMMLWHTLFIVLLVMISAQSRRCGLERVLRLLVPLMTLLLVVGVMYGGLSEGMAESIQYILYPDLSRVDAGMPLLALQRAFFTLLLGLGVMVIYGAYADEQVSIGYASFLVILIDLLFSIVTGLAINALVFSVDMEPVLDDELAFRVLPVVFGSMPMGHIFGALFYLFLALAAITTAVALMEALVSCFCARYGDNRLRAATQLGIIVWLIGLGSIFSYSLWPEDGITLAIYFADEAHRLVNNAGFNDIIVFIASQLLQPLAALLLAIFIGWKLPRVVTHDALALRSRKLFELWNFAIRYIVPALLLIVFFSTLGVLQLT